MNIESFKLGNLELSLCKYQLTNNTITMDTCNTIYLHGTVKHNTVDALLEHHLSRGFAGIGYHFAIAQDGHIYYTRPLNVQGAHTYGRNKNSIGVVVFDINKDKPSIAAINNFSSLKKELDHIYNKKLPVHSHTHAQFEYLKAQLTNYNITLDNNKQFKIPQFNHDMPLAEEFIKHKTELVNESIILRNNGVPKSKRPEFNRVIRLIDSLKLCPAKNYDIFMGAL